MACAALVLYLLPLFCLMPYSSLAQNNSRISVGASLTATEGATPWLSPSGDFAFGFKHLQETDLFLLSIWYNKIPDTIVWFANYSSPVQRGAKVELTSDKGLVLTDPQSNGTSWYTQVPNRVVYGLLNDTGNLILLGSDSGKLWESFQRPTDTLLPTQIMEMGGVLISRRSEANFSRGRFQLRFQTDGNLVLYPVNVQSNLAYDAYYATGTYSLTDPSTAGYQLIFNDKGYLYILRRNNQRFDLNTVSGPASGYYYRATLNFDGVFVIYSHPKAFTGNQSWGVVWYQPENICLRISGGIGSGACGYNSICRVDGLGRPSCECPKGYTLLDQNDKYGSCVPNFVQSCGENEAGSAENLYDFEELVNIDWPTSDYEKLSPCTEDECRNACLHDCFCAVAVHRGDCWKKKLPLSNGREGTSLNSKVFLKYNKSGIPGNNSPPPFTPDTPRTKQKQRSLSLVASVLLGTSGLINLVLLVAICSGFFFIYRKKTKKIAQGNDVTGTNLRCFTYKELAQATNGFKQELGRGAFGIVYRGVIAPMVPMASDNIIAVKKLDSVAQDADKEFRTEVSAIGKTHHKNLVRLYGFCDEEGHRLLVYEYLSNGTLASYLFGDKEKPSWEQRTQMALGIAKGLSYLHEECSTQIIHCDIKPQNILLDDYYNARISDFGLAKLLMINQSRTNTGIRGTKGYVAPEWFRKIPITAKVDVYSYGVLLLEIICCRKSLEDSGNVGEGKEILTDWVWDCFQGGRLDALVENDVGAFNDWNKLERLVMVGIWCIQEDPSLRPTMRKVSQMLEGVVEVTVPPCPFLPFSFTG